METKYINLGKHFWGLATSFIALLVGGWLMVAPYALGYQPYGTVWIDQTQVSFWTGLAVAIIAVISLAAFMTTLLGELHRFGVIQRRQRRPRQQKATQPAQEPAPIPVTGHTENDFEQAMATLASALAADLEERRKGHNGEGPKEQVRTETYEKTDERSRYE